MLDFFINPRRMSAPMNGKFANQPEAMEDWGAYYVAPEATDSLPYSIYGDIGVIEVGGSLASGSIPYWYFMADVAYEGIIATIDELKANPQIQTIVIAWNSPGGTVTGCAETAAAIRERAANIEIISFCRMADSAAYWLASATDKIYLDPTGEVGSIGVIMTHIDMSKMLEEWGIKATHIISGSHKADGSPYQELSESAQTRLQAEVDLLRGLFAEHVSLNRGLSLDEVLATEALTYIGQQAVAIKLADDTGFLSDVIAQLSGSTETIQTSTKETRMARKTPAAKTAKGKKPAKQATQEEQVANPEDVENETPDDEGTEEGAESEEENDGEEETEGAEKTGSEVSTDARKAERERINAIVSCEEAKGKTSLANHFALETDMSVEAAKKALQAAAPEKVSGNALATAMGKVGNPSIGTDGKGADAPKSGLMKQAAIMSGKAA